ncbi:oxygen-insensitive NADPH nitroreductase [Clostridium polynesiense]|uniref:oxygen-insensitive NADPH nitroreductase n=1 Tax=Clostridium polynesiense TaxID=1325933 RepID=UPI00058E69AF|nr:oxygen-insensitive NADPH nitroreductase [Clostridium polynesiense]
MNETINLLKSHRSIRKYKNQPIEEEKIKAVIECAQSASTANFVQAYTIIRVNDMEKRKKIAHFGGDQVYIEECPVFFVFCADLNRIKKACEYNGKTMAEGYTEAFTIATIDTALAAQNAFIAAESLGLGGVYIGGIRNNPSEICEVLNIPANVYPMVGLCLGYPDENPGKKERLPMDIILKNDTYSIEDDFNNIKEYDASIQEYYRNRTNGQRTDTWTSQVSNLMSKPQRPHMREFLKKQGFEMK